MNLSTEDVEAAAVELMAVGWLERERKVWWLVAKLAHEPGYDWRNKKDKRSTSVANHIAKLRCSEIVRRFAERYEFTLPEERNFRPVLHANRSEETKARPDTIASEDALMGLVRRCLYIDGQPAPGWDPARDRLIMREILRTGIGFEGLGEAISGLGLMRDSGDLQIAAPGGPLTLRPLWDGRKKAVTDAVRMAREYYAQAIQSQLTDGGALQSLLDEIAGKGRAA